jgi:zinc transporter ZupT
VADEDKAAAILQAARAERRGSSRTMWIVALAIGVACSIGFVLLMLRDGSTSQQPKHAVQDHGLGFGAGVLVGAAVGIGVGFAIARQRQSARNTP